MIPNKFQHLIGVWNWEKSKLFSHPPGENYKVKYRTPETEYFNAQIEITENGELKTFKRNRLTDTYIIKSFVFTEENTNSPIFYHYRMVLSKKRWFSFFKLEKEILIYQWENENRFSAMYFFPFDTKNGGSYNWFSKK